MEFLRSRWRWVAFTGLLVIIVFTGVSGYILVQFEQPNTSVGVQLVKAMYEFESLEEAERNVSKLRSVVSDSVWDQITFGNDSRIISTYYKFQTLPSKVTVRVDEPGLVIYSLENEYVLGSRLFVLDYKQSGRVISEIREYEIKGYCWGVEGVIP